MKFFYWANKQLLMREHIKTRDSLKKFLLTIVVKASQCSALVLALDQAEQFHNTCCYFRLLFFIFSIMTMKSILTTLIEYETPRYVKVHNPLVGLVLR